MLESKISILQASDNQPCSFSSLTVLEPSLEEVQSSSDLGNCNLKLCFLVFS